MNPELGNNEQEEHDFLNEFRQRVASNSFSDIEEKEKLRHKKNKGIFIGVLGGVVLAGVIGWFLVSPKFGGYDEGQVPVVRRDESPIKVKPSDPGGLDIPNRDKSVYGIIEEGNDEAVVEKLLPAVEQPIQPAPVVAAEDPIADLATKIEAEQDMLKSAKEAMVEADKIVAAAPVEVVKKTETTVVKETPKPVPTITETKSTTVAQETVKAIPEPLKTVETKPTPVVKEAVETAPTKVVKENVKPAPTPVPTTTVAPTKGSWQVQIVSGKNKKAVEDTQTKLYKKHTTILSGVSSEVVKADLGTKGIYYRLMLGSYVSKTDANNLCTKLKAAKESCFVKQKK